MTRYDESLDLPVAYPPQTLSNGLGEYLSGLGLSQFRIAETEKYAHVTYFLNGGNEQAFPNEVRQLVPSPQVDTYDLQPEMSAPAVTDALIHAIESRRYQLLVCNYANGDMVGHTGNLEAAIRAVETLDTCLARVIPTMLACGGEVLLTADHGNAEDMFDHQSGQPHTAHTLNPVPLAYMGRPARMREGGRLADIAPTLLAMMGLPQPPEMTGRSLVDLESAVPWSSR
jgi:2,3-bisphosphoglycerate-independent phosphoglycerate mutase